MSTTMTRESEAFAAALNSRNREDARDSAERHFRLAVAILREAQSYDWTQDRAARVVAVMHDRETWQQRRDETHSEYMSRIETRELHDIFIRRCAAGLPAWPADDESFDAMIVTP